MSAPKFMQIATAASVDGHALYALDDSGAVWEYEWTADGGPAWKRLSTKQLEPK